MGVSGADSASQTNGESDNAAQTVRSHHVCQAALLLAEPTPEPPSRTEVGLKKKRETHSGEPKLNCRGGAGFAIGAFGSDRLPSPLSRCRHSGDAPLSGVLGENDPNVASPSNFRGPPLDRRKPGNRDETGGGFAEAEAASTLPGDGSRPPPPPPPPELPPLFRDLLELNFGEVDSSLFLPKAGGLRLEKVKRGRGADSATRRAVCGQERRTRCRVSASQTCAKGVDGYFATFVGATQRIGVERVREAVGADADSACCGWHTPSPPRCPASNRTGTQIDTTHR